MTNSIMAPTARLRWVKVRKGVPAPSDVVTGSIMDTRLILQQWWTDSYGGGEWESVKIGGVWPDDGGEAT